MGYRPKKIPSSPTASHERKRRTKGMRPHVARERGADKRPVYLDTHAETVARRRELLEAAGLKPDAVLNVDQVTAELVYAALEGGRPVLTFFAEVTCPKCKRLLRVDQRGYGRVGPETYLSPRMRVKFKPDERSHNANTCLAKLILEKF